MMEDGLAGLVAGSIYTQVGDPPGGGQGRAGVPVARNFFVNLAIFYVVRAMELYFDGLL